MSRQLTATPYDGTLIKFGGLAAAPASRRTGKPQVRTWIEAKRVAAKSRRQSGRINLVRAIQLRPRKKIKEESEVRASAAPKVKLCMQ